MKYMAILKKKDCPAIGKTLQNSLFLLTHSHSILVLAVELKNVDEKE
jgi:hypothetical protein